MIRAVTVTNYLGESKRFELAFPDESEIGRASCRERVSSPV